MEAGNATSRWASTSWGDADDRDRAILRPAEADSPRPTGFRKFPDQDNPEEPLKFRAPASDDMR